MPRLEGKTVEERKWLKDRNKFTTGFCNNINKPAQCEGTKPRSGNLPLPTCSMWEKCPCSCHFNVDKLFEATGMERRLIPNPDYDPPHDEFVMPEYEIDPVGDVAATLRGGIDHPEDQRPVTANVAPAATPLAQRRTDTGRAARGGLEAQVWDICHRVLQDGSITPKIVADMIAEKYGIPTPSTGAINAVWDRWEKLGFATQAKKPNRLTGFTGEGTWEELSRMKAMSKHQKKDATSRAQRGYRDK